jgi:hypothetical protein
MPINPFNCVTPNYSYFTVSKKIISSNVLAGIRSGVRNVYESDIIFATLK